MRVSTAKMICFRQALCNACNRPCLAPALRSLLTSFTFIKLATKFFQGVEGASKHMGILYGLGVDGDGALKGYQENGA